MFKVLIMGGGADTRKGTGVKGPKPIIRRRINYLFSMIFIPLNSNLPLRCKRHPHHLRNYELERAIHYLTVAEAHTILA